MEYQDFEIEITTGPDGVHQVNVLEAPAGEVRQALTFGLSDDALREQLAQIEAVLRYREHETVADRRARLAEVKAFGSDLFHALINDNLKSLYDQSRYMARQQEQGLRLKLRIDAPLLAAVPWELLYDPRHDEFLANSRQVSIVRYLALPRAAHLLATKPPLNVLGIVSTPEIPGLPPLDVAQEKKQVADALQSLVDKGLASLTWLPAADWRTLQRAMNRGPWHVLHFVGHSDFDPELDEGYISLVDEDGREDKFTAGKLATLLADHGALRLVVLNACMGARIGQDIYTGVATTLVRRGIPAVIGMQYDISDAAALELSRTFYETLTGNLSIETALAEARKALSLAVDESAEWGTPVLYTHAPDSMLFDVTGSHLDSVSLNESEFEELIKLGEFESVISKLKHMMHENPAHPQKSACDLLIAVAHFRGQLANKMTKKTVTIVEARLQKALNDSSTEKAALFVLGIIKFDYFYTNSLPVGSPSLTYIRDRYQELETSPYDWIEKLVKVSPRAVSYLRKEDVRHD